MLQVKKIFKVTLALGVIFFVIFLNLDNSQAFSSIITCLSIMTGFTITAMSIIANSQFSGHLYKIEDAEDNSKTLLHILVYRFKDSTLLFIMTIILILLYFFIDDKEIVWKTISILSHNLNFKIILKALIWSLTGLSVINFVRLLLLFSEFVIKNATKIK